MPDFISEIAIPVICEFLAVMLFVAMIGAYAALGAGA